MVERGLLLPSYSIKTRPPNKPIEGLSINNNTLQNQESKELYCVYMHTNITSGKGYIGYTVVGINKRFKKHMENVKSKSNSHFHRALRLYGEEAFTSEIIYISFKKR